ncbi:hypothetical protein ACFQ8W_00475 [Streptomyces sp. NPDC056508]|uniref:hypothetical protein n=1 Tax=Streptomyces sp. NPDC056508 TaxID=3345845 RepID=UPI003696F6CF
MAEVEAVIAPWLGTVIDGLQYGAETPPDLESRLPFVRVERLGGFDDRFRQHPRIAVDVFAATADEARATSSAVRDALLALRGEVRGAVVSDVRCDSGPSRQPWTNGEIHRRGALYTVTLRDA